MDAPMICMKRRRPGEFGGSWSSGAANSRAASSRNSGLCSSSAKLFQYVGFDVSPALTEACVTGALDRTLSLFLDLSLIDDMSSSQLEEQCGSSRGTLGRTRDSAGPKSCW